MQHLHAKIYIAPASERLQGVRLTCEERDVAVVMDLLVLLCDIRTGSSCPRPPFLRNHPYQATARAAAATAFPSLRDLQATRTAHATRRE